MNSEYSPPPTPEELNSIVYGTTSPEAQKPKLNKVRIAVAAGGMAITSWLIQQTPSFLLNPVIETRHEETVDQSMSVLATVDEITNLLDDVSIDCPPLVPHTELIEAKRALDADISDGESVFLTDAQKAEYSRIKGMSIGMASALYSDMRIFSDSVYRNHATCSGAISDNPRVNFLQGILRQDLSKFYEETQQEAAARKTKKNIELARAPLMIVSGVTWLVYGTRQRFRRSR